MDLVFFHNETIKLPEYPGYEANRNGHIYSFRQGKRKKLDEYLCNERAKYKHVVLRNTEGKPITLYVHRLISSMFLGPCPKNYRPSHRDGNTFHNAVRNLFYEEIKMRVGADSKGKPVYISYNEIFSEVDQELFAGKDETEQMELSAYILSKIKRNKLIQVRSRNDFYKTLKQAF